MAKTNLKKEFKALGSDIATALKVMKDSREFKKLQKDLAVGVKSIATSLKSSLQAAQKSPQTSQLKKRLGRVVKLGKKEGLIQAKKAEIIAAQKIKQMRDAIRKMRKKTEEN